MDSVSGKDVAGCVAQGTSLTHSGIHSVLGKMPSGVLVQEVKAKTKTATSDSACPFSTQPLAAFTTASAGKVDPIPLPQWQSTYHKLGSLPAKMDGRWVESDVANFVKKLGDFNSNVATDLQNALENDALTESGWFGRYWDDMYLKLRSATPINISFALKLNLPEVDTGTSSEETHSFYPVSGAILGAHEHLQMIQEKRLAVDQERGKALCMSQPEKLFGHRQACKDKDELIPCPQGNAQHIIVLSKGQLYRVQVSDESGKKISVHNLANTLTEISLKPKQDDAVDLTPMTSGNRNECAELQKDFVEFSEANRNVWQQVEGAFCCVCMDDPGGGDDSGKQLLAGIGSNRCFDKSLQFICMDKGEVGVTIEHSAADAGAWLPMANRAIKLLNSAKHYDGELASNDKRLAPDIDDSMKSRLASASDRFNSHLSQVELKEVNVHNISQAVLKDKGISPDAFYQLMFQLAAYHAGYDHPPTYESVSMRQFKYGRTDDLRSYSPEVMKFLTAFGNASSSDDVKADLLRKAFDAHKQRIKDCKAGEGICRHLFALEKKWEELYPNEAADKPALFTDSVYQDLVKKSTLSTSCVADESISRFVFGPVENDGLGIAYYPTEHDLRVTVSWQKDNEKGQVFVASLEKAANQLLGMLGIKQLQP